MMRRPAMQRDLARIDGYTLLEMLVVCAILALAASAAAGLARPRNEAARIEASARELAARLRFARSRAIAQNSDVSVVFDLARAQYFIEGTPPGKFPEGARVVMTLAEPEKTNENRGAIRFFPSGEASGGTIGMQLGKAHASVAVDWLTGAAQVMP